MWSMLSRRGFVASAGAAALAQGQGRRRPNVVLFLADDLGCHDLGCWGASDLQTPHIDAIAASGARFTNWYSAAPVCAPARAALLTGRYPIRAGVPDNGPPLRSSEMTIASALKPAGYATALIGKWHLGPDPNAHGFDRFFGFKSGCIDYFSHRYYWGRAAHGQLSRPLARPDRNLRGRPVLHRPVRARSRCVRQRASRRPV